MERPTWTSWVWPAATGGLVLLLAAAFLLPEIGGLWTVLLLAGVIVIACALLAWAFVEARRQRRSFEARMEAWAGENAAHEERLRIARDLHDLASHGLGLITVRATTANLTADEDDAERRAALTDIERLGREATTELRRMLTVLRGTISSPAPLRPADTLDDLPGIVENATRAGLSVSLHVEPAGELTPGIQLTICATVREALSNTLRYAGPTTTATILLARTDDTITVDVQDDGPRRDWHPHPGAGHGLAGLRERVALHSGTLTTGPHQDGFRVLAELPATSAVS